MSRDYPNDLTDRQWQVIRERMFVQSEEREPGENRMMCGSIGAKEAIQSLDGGRAMFVPVLEPEQTDDLRINGREPGTFLAPFQES
jgi:hypothetical protein